MTAPFASALAALVAGVCASREDFGKPTPVPANGYVTICYGRHVFELPYPIALRSLFPLLIGPKRWKLDRIVVNRDSWRCRSYQMARMAFAWGAFWFLSAAYGPAVMAVAAAVFILSIRFDYWSNFVELLAASIVFSVGPLGIPWPVQLASGLVLGLGRETLPLLALAPGGIPLAAGSLMSQVAVRLLRKENPRNAALAAATMHGKCRLDDVLLLLRVQPWETWPRVALYVSIIALSASAVPFQAAALGIMTFTSSRIDEPRILTQLIPWAALRLTGLM